MEENRLPHKAYLTLLHLETRGKKNWATNVKLCLFEYGYGHVWLNQGVANVQMFIREFRQRIIDCNWQNWQHHIQTSERFQAYSLFNGIDHSVKKYLSLNLNRTVKQITSKFRFGVSDIKAHYFRYRIHTDLDLLCPMCKERNEDELHFVLMCPATQSIRERFVPEKYYRDPCLFRLVMLMSSANEIVTKRFSMFLYHAFKIRDKLCS
eukprot:TRINITY_DN7891_c0_g1_i1.p1 TRINITY_DN7891_c0_g1~~TRINITY_DN7891_c0_g1_i1.p1  ORF type:complete len:208 (+),score=5.68 TRINITY_DN7891_c0_g1_i1:260-883(+)